MIRHPSRASPISARFNVYLPLTVARRAPLTTRLSAP